MDSENEYDAGEDASPWLRRFRKGDVLVLAFSLCTDVIGALHGNLMTTTQMIAGHVNWQNDRADFHEEAAREIETIVNGEQDG